MPWKKIGGIRLYPRECDRSIESKAGMADFGDQDNANFPDIISRHFL